MSLIYRYDDGAGFYTTIDLRDVSSTVAQISEGVSIITISLKNSSIVCSLDGDRVADFMEMYNEYIDWVNDGRAI